jgi:hypothetical protein
MVGEPNTIAAAGMVRPIDPEMPADAQSIAIVRKNFVVLWAPAGLER